MIVSHRHRFIFVKTRKTGGTSVEIMLSKHCGIHDIVTMVNANDEAMRREYGGMAPQNLFIPLRYYNRRHWKRLLTGHGRMKFLKHLPAARIRQCVGNDVWNDYYTFCIERNPWEKVISFWHWRRLSQGYAGSLRDFVMSPALDELSDWRLYTDNQEIIVNEVIPYELLSSNLHRVFMKFDIPFPAEMPRAKGTARTDRRPSWQVLQPDERDRIAEVFAREIEHFGYTYRPTRSVN